jgi:FkbM family methyltransferase
MFSGDHPENAGLGRKAMLAGRSLAQRFGITVERTWRLEDWVQAQHLQELFRSRQIDCVVDVGANQGQVRDYLRKDVGWTGPIASIEPVPENVEVLRHRARSDRRWTIHSVALGDADERRELNVTGSSVFSSFLDPQAVDQYGWDNERRIERRVSVPVQRFETFVAELPAPKSRIFLKCDTQGWDVQVLEGLGSAADRVRAIQIEVALIPIYAGMADWRLALNRLKEMGFDVTGFFPVSRTPDLRAIELDCVAARAQPDQSQQGAGHSARAEGSTAL